MALDLGLVIDLGGRQADRYGPPSGFCGANSSSNSQIALTTSMLAFYDYYTKVTISVSWGLNEIREINRNCFRWYLNTYHLGKPNVGCL